MAKLNMRYLAWNKSTNSWDYSFNLGLHSLGRIFNSSSVNVTQNYQLCFSTGLFDRTGMEIYRGHVLLNDLERTAIVEWDGINAKFCLVGTQESLATFAKESEVIGHILETPEFESRKP